MLEKPRNYEEAKIVIKNSINDDLQKYNKSWNKKRSIVITSICAAVAVAIGAAKGVSVGLASVPFLGVVSLSSLAPFIIRKNVDKEIQSGAYFKDKSEEDIIKIASAYVDQYNDFEKKRAK